MDDCIEVLDLINYPRTLKWLGRVYVRLDARHPRDVARLLLFAEPFVGE